MSPARRTPEQRDAAELEESMRLTAQQQRDAQLATSPDDGEPSPAEQLPAIAADYVHTTHPDTGVDVTFIPGEALPEWARSPQTE